MSQSLTTPAEPTETDTAPSVPPELTFRHPTVEQRYAGRGILESSCGTSDPALERVGSVQGPQPRG